MALAPNSGDTHLRPRRSLGAPGNSEWAKRAAVAATNIIIVAIGVTIGLFFGGTLGAALGITTSIGHRRDRNQGNNWLRSEFEEVTVGRYIYDTIFSMLATGAGKQVGMSMKKISHQRDCQDFKRFGGGFQMGIQEGGSEGIKTVLDKLGDVFIKEQLPQDWLETERKVKNI